MPEGSRSVLTRRRALEAIVAGVLAVPAAGCLGDGAATPGSGDARWIEDPATVHRGVPATPGWDLPDDAFAAVHVADGEAAEDVVWLWNDSTEGRDLVVDLRAEGTDLFRRTVAFPPDGVVEVALFTRSNYRIDVGPPGTPSTVEYPASRFDCNERALDVRVRSGGAVESLFVGTDVGCG